MEKTLIKCTDCEATFTLKKNMYAHCRNTFTKFNI